jgi:hypothetical protein
VKKTIVSALCMAAVLSAVSDSVAAWPFGGSKKNEEKKKAGNVVMPPETSAGAAEAATNAAANRGRAMARRVHLVFETDAAEQEFLQYAVARRRVQEDGRVLARIASEKRLEIARFQQELKDEFQINPEANYQFDDETSTIYVLAPREGAPTNATASIEERFNRTEHLKIDAADQRERFLRLVAAKQLATEEQSVLALLQNEKEIEADTVHQQMVARYAITNDREYRYDRSRKTLYELVPMPGGTSAGEISTEEAAVKE